MTVIELEESAIWWNGAKFLHSSEHAFEKADIISTVTASKELCERTVKKSRRGSQMLYISHIMKNDSRLAPLRFLSWTQLKKILA